MTWRFVLLAGSLTFLGLALCDRAAVAAVRPALMSLPTSNAQGDGFVFVGGGDYNDVNIYKAGASNPSVFSSIGFGILNPAGLAVDSAGTLYTTSSQVVTEYAAGYKRPTFTLHTGLDIPQAIAVDSARTVYVADAVNGIVEFRHGTTQPFRTIKSSEVGRQVAEAIDNHGNLFVANSETGHVYEIPSGTSTVNDLHVCCLSQPVGIAFDSNNLMYISNAGGIYVYRLGQKAPIRVILTSFNNGQLCFARNGMMYVVATYTSVAIFRPRANEPFGSITKGIALPLGIAASP